jgi:hypothetical protein
MSPTTHPIRGKRLATRQSESGAGRVGRFDALKSRSSYMLVISFFFVVASLGVAPLSVTEEEVAAKVKAFDPNRSKTERLAAAKWFVNHAPFQETLKALTHLEQVVRNDNSPDVCAWPR